jgi:hypothetical protein
VSIFLFDLFCNERIFFLLCMTKEYLSWMWVSRGLYWSRLWVKKINSMSASTSRTPLHLSSRTSARYFVLFNFCLILLTLHVKSFLSLNLFLFLKHDLELSLNFDPDTNDIPYDSDPQCYVFNSTDEIQLKFQLRCKFASFQYSRYVWNRERVV